MPVIHDSMLDPDIDPYWTCEGCMHEVEGDVYEYLLKLWQVGEEIPTPIVCSTCDDRGGLEDD